MKDLVLVMEAGLAALAVHVLVGLAWLYGGRAPALDSARARAERIEQARAARTGEPVSSAPVPSERRGPA